VPLVVVHRSPDARAPAPPPDGRDTDIVRPEVVDQARGGELGPLAGTHRDHACAGELCGVAAVVLVPPRHEAHGQVTVGLARLAPAEQLDLVGDELGAVGVEVVERRSDRLHDHRGVTRARRCSSSPGCVA
jgi:hypothetical protein